MSDDDQTPTSKIWYATTQQRQVIRDSTTGEDSSKDVVNATVTTWRFSYSYYFGPHYVKLIEATIVNEAAPAEPPLQLKVIRLHDTTSGDMRSQEALYARVVGTNQVFAVKSADSDRSLMWLRDDDAKVRYSDMFTDATLLLEKEDGDSKEDAKKKTDESNGDGDERNSDPYVCDFVPVPANCRLVDSETFSGVVGGKLGGIKNFGGEGLLAFLFRLTDASRKDESLEGRFDVASVVPLLTTFIGDDTVGQNPEAVPGGIPVRFKGQPKLRRLYS